MYDPNAEKSLKAASLRQQQFKKKEKEKKRVSLLQLKGNPAIKFTKYLAEEHAECFVSY